MSNCWREFFLILLKKFIDEKSFAKLLEMLSLKIGVQVYQIAS